MAKTLEDILPRELISPSKRSQYDELSDYIVSIQKLPQSSAARKLLEDQVSGMIHMLIDGIDLTLFKKQKTKEISDLCAMVKKTNNSNVRSSYTPSYSPSSESSSLGSSSYSSSSE